MFDLFAIDVRRMDYRCSIDVRWKCPSFLPSFLPSFFLPVLLRPLHFLCSVCASLVPFFPSLKKASRKSIESLSKSIARLSIEIESLSKVYWKVYRNFYRKSIEHLSQFYRKSAEILSKVYRRSIETSIESLLKVYRKPIESLSESLSKLLSNIYIWICMDSHGASNFKESPVDDNALDTSLFFFAPLRYSHVAKTAS